MRISDWSSDVCSSDLDPYTAEELHELVEVGPAGVVDTWCWIRQPMPSHPLDRPFACALVRPDGADAGFLQVVDAGSAEAISTGLRVRPRCAAEREASITDLQSWDAET